MFQSIMTAFTTLALGIASSLGINSSINTPNNVPQVEESAFAEVELDEFTEESFEVQSAYKARMDTEVKAEKARQTEQHSESAGYEEGQTQNTGVTAGEPEQQTEAQKTDEIDTDSNDDEETDNTETEDDNDADVEVNMEVPDEVKDGLDRITGGIRF